MVVPVPLVIVSSHQSESSAAAARRFVKVIRWSNNVIIPN